MGKIDANNLLRAWLLQPIVTISGIDADPPDFDSPTVDLINPIIPLIGQRVWAGALPEGFDPSQGVGIVISRGGSGMSSGGDSENEISLTNPHMQIRVWAGLNAFPIASAMYNMVHDWIDGRNNIAFPGVGFVMNCNEVVEPMDVRDTTTGFSTVMGFFDMKLRDN